VLPVVGDVLVDSEALVVTSSIFEDAHKSRVYVRVFIGVRVRVCVHSECLSCSV
jgi:hypothetical protein